MRGLGFVMLCALAGAARAGTVGIVVSGEPAVKPATSRWLEDHGHRVVDPLPPDAVSTLVDCYVIEDAGCAQAVVAQRSTSDAVLYVAVATAGDSTEITVRWLVSGQPAREQRKTCSHCTEALHGHVEAMLVQLVGTTKAAQRSVPATSPDGHHATAAGTSESHTSRGLAIGIELGEPTAVTAGWFAGRLAIVGAVGSGTFEGPGIAAHLNVHYAITELAPRIPLFVGLGGRFYHHGYEAMSFDEVPDSHYGFASVGIALERGAMQLYAELSPGVDVTARELHARQWSPQYLPARAGGSAVRAARRRCALVPLSLNGVPCQVPSLVSLLALAACAGDPATVEVALSPSVISSLDGSTTVTAIVATTP